MVMKAEQERVTTLLRETITLLCRNGLSFNAEFSIEALIGITLDKDDVFLISIKELIQSEKCLKSNTSQGNVRQNTDNEFDGQESSDSHGNTGNHGNRGQGRRKRRKRSCLNLEDNEVGYVGSPEVDVSDRLSEEPNSKKSNNIDTSQNTLQYMKKEVGSDENSSDGVLFIKQELQSDWSEKQPSESIPPDLTAYQDGYDDPSMATLSGSNLVPVGSLESSAIWNQTMMSAGSSMSINQGATSTITSDGTTASQQENVELWPGTGVFINARQLAGITQYAPSPTKLACRLIQQLIPSSQMQALLYYRNVADNIRTAVENFTINFEFHDQSVPRKSERDIRKALRDKFSDMKRRDYRKKSKQSSVFADLTFCGQST